MSKYVVQATWDDCPHLTEQAKKELWASIPPHQRDARSKGIPQLGSGAIYPVPESDIIVRDFPIPDHWPRCCGLDVGWNRTAAVWVAQDRESGVYYLYSEHYVSEEKPAMHAEAIKARGQWIPGVIDPASRGRSQHDGNQLIQNYIDLGVNLNPADNAVEAGLQTIWILMTSGKFRVFSSLSNWIEEFRLYRRDDKGKVVKAKDHLMDATRYAFNSGRDRMRTKPVKVEPKPEYYDYGHDAGSWMG